MTNTQHDSIYRRIERLESILSIIGSSEFILNIVSEIEIEFDK